MNKGGYFLNVGRGCPVRRVFTSYRDITFRVRSSTDISHDLQATFIGYTSGILARVSEVTTASLCLDLSSQADLGTVLRLTNDRSVTGFEQ